MAVKFFSIHKDINPLFSSCIPAFPSFPLALSESKSFPSLPICFVSPLLCGLTLAFIISGVFPLFFYSTILFILFSPLFYTPTFHMSYFPLFFYTYLLYVLFFPLFYLPVFYISYFPLFLIHLSSLCLVFPSFLFTYFLYVLFSPLSYSVETVIGLA